MIVNIVDVKNFLMMVVDVVIIVVIIFSLIIILFEIEDVIGFGKFVIFLI